MAVGLIWRAMAGAGNRASGLAMPIIRGAFCDLAAGGITRAGVGCGFRGQASAARLVLLGGAGVDLWEDADLPAGRVSAAADSQQTAL